VWRRSPREQRRASTDISNGNILTENTPTLWNERRGHISQSNILG
jgi:hypothetical protein